MNESDIEIAVLEELGYVKISDGDEYNFPKWTHSDWDHHVCEQHKLPDYTRSLDACQKMLADLKDEELPIFDKHLAEIPHVGYSWMVKPIDLCVAFLQTRGYENVTILQRPWKYEGKPEHDQCGWQPN